MTSHRKLLKAAMVAIICCIVARAQIVPDEPISKSNFLSALESMQLRRSKRKPPSWWIEIVEKERVAFEITPGLEAEIRHRGRYLRKKGLDDLIAAIRDNRPGTPESSASATPITKAKPDFPVERITTTTDSIPSRRPDLPFGLQITIQSNVTISNPHFGIECDGPIGRGEVGRVGPSFTEVIIHHKMVDPNTWEVFLDKPPITPQHPLLVYVYSATKINLIRVVRLN